MFSNKPDISVVELDPVHYHQLDQPVVSAGGPRTMANGKPNPNWSLNQQVRLTVPAPGQFKFTVKTASLQTVRLTLQEETLQLQKPGDKLYFEESSRTSLT